MNKFLTTILILLTAVFGFGGGLVAAPVLHLDALPAPVTLDEHGRFDTTLLWEAWDQLRANFFEQSSIKPDSALYGAISGLVKSLDDPYTNFLNPQDSKRFLEDVSGEFEGVGMEIGVREGQLQVISPLEDTPAWRAGIKAGDRILQIDKTPTADLSVDEAVNLIRGPKGSAVTLIILGGTEQKSRKVQITRERIKIPSLKLEVRTNNIAYLRLAQFSQTADAEFRQAAVQILNSSARGIVLDLRNNPGGFLQVAQDIAGWFLPAGKVVAVERFADGQERLYKSPGPTRLGNLPVVVLINQGSASAAEILAAALSEQAASPLVGEQSFGKGSVQEVTTLSDNSSLKITVAQWLTPNKNLIHDVGLTPDYPVEFSQEQLDNNQDPQLDKALELLETTLNL